jgi:hypothetical protein
VATCGHDTANPTRVCRHLLERELEHVERFTGEGIVSELVCEACTAATELVDACATCREAAAAGGSDRTLGEPGIIDAASSLAFEHRRVIGLPALLELQPVVGTDRDHWIGVGRDGCVHALDLDRGQARRLAHLPAELVTLDQPILLRLTSDARLAAVANGHGVTGAVIELATGRVTMELRRDRYHPEHCVFPVAFVERGGRELLVHATDWNRLDVSDAHTGELLTAREPTSYTRDEPRPPHYLDYFHGRLAISPDGRRIADDGWVWSPVGVVTTWSLERWLEDNVWESEDGPSLHQLCYRDSWDLPLCWLDADRLAVWGYGSADPLVPAVRIFDAETAHEERWFAGPRGQLFFDRVLVSAAPDVAEVWDVDAGARLARDRQAAITHHHPSAKTFVGLDPAGQLVTTRLRGGDATWCRGVIADLARSIARDRSFEDLPVLGDALEQAGYTDREVLAHCQRPGPHAERCWVIERLLAEP